jgi:ankyrin repeat protein
MKPLTAAYKYRCIDAIKLLLEKGADPQSIVRDVIKDNNLSILKLLVPCVGLSYIDYNTSPSVVEFLLSNGEMVGIDTFKQITDKSQSTNLHLLEVLLKSLNGEVSYWSKEVPLIHHAIINKYPNMLEIILKYQKDIDIRDKDGNSALHIVSKHGNKDMVAMLLESGADPNKINTKGNTPLHHACKVLDPDDIVKQLLRYNADPNIPNALGITPMQEALTACNLSIIDLLKQNGGKLDEMDIYDEGDDEYEDILNHLSEDIYATDNWYRRTLDYGRR